MTKTHNRTNNKNVIKTYVKNIDDVACTGIATEQSYYPAVKDMIEGVCGGVSATADAKVIDGNKPDFTVIAKNGDLVGYIEVKSPETDINKELKSEQLGRYISAFPNFIFTNCHEFQLWSNGARVQTTNITSYNLDGGGADRRYEELTNMLNRFASKTISVESEVSNIAEQLASIARDTLKPAISDRLNDETKAHDRNDTQMGDLLSSYTDFKNDLIHDLTPDQFVDMYAQTITYGLLTAKMNHGSDGFTRDTAIRDIPKEFGVLHSVFKFIATDDLPKEIETAIHEIVAVLNRTEPNNVMERYYTEKRGKEWFIHFYESFLSKYNPEERKSRGVYYTPDSVVSYITRSVNQVLKDKFNKRLGFGDTSVEVLDPATGTMSFLASACQIAIDEKKTDGDGMINEFIHDHVLKHFYGYELMMTPYALAHLKMKSVLDKNNYTLKLPRSRILLVNALDAGNKSTQTSLLSDIGRAVTKEALCAHKVHNRDGIIAVIGNPPYSVSSSNKGMLNKKMELYKAGVKSERNIMPLSDDYIKFMRLAHKQVDDQGKGVIGFITNNSYLGGLIHRGMREELMKSFDDIYILNLHGHAGVDPKGDKNVFNIKQGVAIAIFVKTSDNKECKVHYSELIGSRENKYDYLDTNSFDTTEWTELEPSEPYYFFEPKDFSGKETYDGFVSVSDVFKERSAGISTSRDVITIQKTKEKMMDVVRDLSTLKIDEIRKNYNLPEKTDTKNWNVENAMKDVKDMVSRDEPISSILYRPFDVEYTYYPERCDGFMHRPCRDIMQHMLHDNIALVGMRQYLYDIDSYNYVFVSNNITDSRIFVSNRGAGSVMPLYLYTNNTKHTNILPSITINLTTTYGTEPTPEDIFYYIYGILYSNTYRAKYAEFLKIDFPKIPFTTNYDLFKRISAIGKQLTDLHLMNPETFTPGDTKYYGQGTNQVDKITYDEETQRVSINKTNYFEPVSPEAWNYQIGGYVVMQKWLKDRRHDTLTTEDADHYRCICNAMETTIELQADADALYNDVEIGDVVALRKTEQKSLLNVLQWENNNPTSIKQ